MHACQARLKTCFDTLNVTFSDGSSAAAIIRRNLAGQVIRRELCTFNENSDVRKCINFDTQDSWTEVKDVDGDWKSIEE